ncbi:MAG: Uma2 family endonuclease [Ardenticatenaceae bacterium]|nr:Uma2 family endonuclease [Ardenticatenaceae bacterium]
MAVLQKRPPSQKGEPLWAIAQLFPYQGYWSESDYLDLNTNHLIEFSDGYIEVLPMPTRSHQNIVAFLYEAILLFVRANQLGKVWFAPLRVRLWPRTYREPDLVFITAENMAKQKGDYPHGADLVVEVVSGSKEDRERDLIKKRAEYAEAGIAEYWIVDPKFKRITVLHLAQDNYEVHGEFAADDTAASKLLAGFAVAVNDVFAAANED